jgi:subtilisin family serine protease
MSRRFVTLVTVSTAVLVAAALAPATAFGRQGSATASRPGAQKWDASVPRGTWVPGEVLVQFKPGISKAGAAAVNARMGGTTVETVGPRAVARVKVTGNVLDAVARYSADPAVEYAEPNYLMEIYDDPPPEPQFSELWGLNNTGQDHCLSHLIGATQPCTSGVDGDAGTPDADMDVVEAWANHTSMGAGVVIGVIDTGADLDHPDLATNLWTNPGETPSNGVDDDGNGVIDDIHGANFVGGGTPSGNPSDNNDHGSHVSGTIAAPDNGQGIIGVCPECQIMALKAGSATGSLSTADVVQAINYAIANGADIVNGSFGGPSWSVTQRNAFAALNTAGILAVLAAGNDSLDNDLSIALNTGDADPNNDAFSPAYPASHRLTNILAVAATQHDDLMGYSNACELFGVGTTRNDCFFTNWGRESVDVGAPGVDILSTIPNNTYDWFDGTSMATPNTAGVAGLILANHPAYTPVQIKNAILNSVDKPASLDEVWPVFLSTSPNGMFTLTTGRVNADVAIDAPTTNSFPTTDSNVNGALLITQSRTGNVNWPNDPNDVFKKSLTRNSTYSVVLNGPDTAARDIDLYVWKPGTLEIWQAGKLRLTKQGPNGNESATFKALVAGVYYFHVSTFFFAPGGAPYTLTVKKV